MTKDSNMPRLPTTISFLALTCAVGVAACIIPDRDIQVVTKNPCGEEWAAQTVGAFGYDNSGGLVYIKTESHEWISEHYCLNHADGLQAVDVTSDLAAELIGHVVQTCQATAANNNLIDVDDTCITTADLVYIGKCQQPSGGCEEPPAETGAETGGTDSTTGLVEFADLDLQAEIGFARGEYLISDRLISTAAADPVGLAYDGTSLELLVDAAGDGRGFKIAGVQHDNLGGLLGLQDGDVVFDIDGHPVLSFEQLLDATTVVLTQDYATVLVERGGSIVSLRYRRW